MAGFIDSPRRWTGAIFLGISILMIVLGFTVLESRLKDFTYICYWLICIGFTLAAAMIALLDFAYVRRKAIHDQRELIEKTIGEIKLEDEKPSESHGQRKSQNT